ncbi:MAG: putative Ig domain-containing protein [Candidatus Nanopelagicales bacterium]|nr:putative Ig domain-containing protein [Candidatus Nanopelagicales bacterium]MCF8537729.1 putative Ig domain-containing protein [Candidatus Nanopelagicales bacterium]MCF8542771.1 putative Ig domain-containing protein [Candidatus Nanopelagicales bacterium]MCF8557871.1 putative Ig domain-containing protein [Candidatus Nanopelagicales bacterium]
MSPPGLSTWTQDESGSLTVVENSGGRAEFSIHPALPQGLSIERSSGDLRGKPTGVVPPGRFVVTGRNSSGTSSVTITLHVTSAKDGTAVAARPADGVTVASLILLSKAPNPSMTRSVPVATQ